jgi:8-amino-7-oxononanoate synthase
MTESKSINDFPGLARLRAELAAMADQQLLRARRLVESPQGVDIRVGGESLLSFSSNDYLGLAADPRVVAAFADGLKRYGAGSGASHLVTGHSVAHHALEEELAAFAGTERALLFSTGYMANLAVAGALLDRHGTVFEDRLNHASLIDAARLSGARVKRFHHGEVERLATQLAETERETGSAADKLILSDGVFSMDGNLARLPELLNLAQQYRSWLLVDDAHGIGVLGKAGRGTFEFHGLVPRAPAILLGTLGKAFGTFGAFVAGEADLIEYLVQRARPYIYTTALPPAVAAATRASLRIVQDEGWRRDVLRERVAQFRTGAAQLGFTLLDSPTPIQPIIIGTAEAALAASEALRQHGILAPAIRPPTVPVGTSRLRISLSAVHTQAHVEQLLTALAEVRV